MAENNPQGGAQNKLGELFVEFGTKGLPSLLKNLNSVSASFLLGKNAATQFADTLTKPFKEAGNTAVGIGKMANALGATNREYQKLATYVESKNVSKGILGDVERFNDIFTKLHAGLGNLPEGIGIELGNLGLSPQDYLGDYESTVKLLNDIRDRTNGLTKQGRNLAFSNLGMSSEWGYLFDRGDFNLSDAFSLPDDVIEKNTKAAESLAELTLAFDQLKSLLAADFAPALTETVNTLKSFVLNFDKNKENIKKTTSVIGGGAAGAAVGSVVPVVGTVTGAIVGGVVGAGKYAIENAHKSGKSNQGEIPLWKQLTDFGRYKDGAPTGGAAPVPDFMNTPEATTPPGMNNLSQNITITNQNNITGDNAQEIATEIARINAQDIEYTQYQLQNLTGI
jgi:hypothetical protein|nr:MAG TPA: bacteriocin [Caudoviricetes sp.]